ncbi:MET16 [Candida oxycetoniae]|uniref:phosphoadenylyl-sulfate reductase (thioredoxin) n=1 Tax=Candida oxycetoniae TaxID=497107 RepID=A0AAI9WWS5_9ASCO|nr:MET16 [Candida oxycetoniae]KAI3403502.1 MET16 [Candida oxycetoniae]
MVGNRDISLTKEHIEFLNQRLVTFSPQDLIKWAYFTFPNLYQTTAFGLTGLAITDMISKISNCKIELIFLDTLYHFPQTYELLERVQEKYPDLLIHVFKPLGVETEAEFVGKYGDQLWETNDKYYDYLVKVEPSQRAYKNLNVNVVLTGRRKSQGGSRSQLSILEKDEANNIIKINPLWNWDFNQVKNYIDENNVPFNELLNLGYKSIGDWHSTVPVADGEDERSGRWKDKVKTECGIHIAKDFAHFRLSDTIERSEIVEKD